jgi:hypothetical protein
MAAHSGDDNFFFGSGIMNDDEGKTAKSDRTSVNLGAAHPPNTAEVAQTQGDGPRKLVDFFTENFLLINVQVKMGEGATREQLIKAIDEALEKAPDIPFFSEHRRTPEGEARKGAQLRGPSGGPCKDEGFLMLVRQEGY